MTSITEPKKQAAQQFPSLSELAICGFQRLVDEGILVASSARALRAQSAVLSLDVENDSVTQAYRAISAEEPKLAEFASLIPDEDTFLKDLFEDYTSQFKRRWQARKPPQDQHIADELESAFDFRSTELRNLKGPGARYYKVNHGFWEALSCVFMGKDVLTTIKIYLNRADVIERNKSRYERSGFLDAFVSAIASCGAQGPSGMFGTECKHPSFGISFLDGIFPNKTILHPDAPWQGSRYAKTYAHTSQIYLSLWPLLSQGRKVSFADGHAPRKLIIENQLEAFTQNLTRDHEAILYVVPPEHSGLCLRDPGKTSQYSVSISGTHVHELWLPTLSVVIGSILELRKRHKSIAIVTQSAVFSGLFGVILDRLDQIAPDLLGSASISYFDLGMAIDAVDRTSVRRLLGIGSYLVDRNNLELSMPFDSSGGNLMKVF